MASGRSDRGDMWPEFSGRTRSNSAPLADLAGDHEHRCQFARGSRGPAWHSLGPAGLWPPPSVIALVTGFLHRCQLMRRRRSRTDRGLAQPSSWALPCRIRSSCTSAPTQSIRPRRLSRRANGITVISRHRLHARGIGVQHRAQRPGSGDDQHSAGRVCGLRAPTRPVVSWAGHRLPGALEARFPNAQRRTKPCPTAYRPC